MKSVITIDGPVASGKSTIARLLACSLGFFYLNSGLLYRSIAYVVLKDHLSCLPDDAQLQTYLDLERLTYTWTRDGQSQVAWDGHDITPLLKTPLIDACSSQLAERAIMRDFIFALQHRIAHTHSIVAEGRDLGSAVFPDATVKFFVTADATIRAQRWQGLQKKLGRQFTLDEAIASITQRDTRDCPGPSYCPTRSHYHRHF
jgi:cytidylate kinase